MKKTKCPSSTPSIQLFAAKLYDGNIIIFDKKQSEFYIYFDLQALKFIISG